MRKSQPDQRREDGCGGQDQRDHRRGCRLQRVDEPDLVDVQSRHRCEHQREIGARDPEGALGDDGEDDERQRGEPVAHGRVRERLEAVREDVAGDREVERPEGDRPEQHQLHGRRPAHSGTLSPRAAAVARMVRLRADVRAHLRRRRRARRPGHAALRVPDPSTAAGARGRAAGGPSRSRCTRWSGSSSSTGSASRRRAQPTPRAPSRARDPAGSRSRRRRRRRCPAAAERDSDASPAPRSWSTGGSRGIGRAIALRLARLGAARVAIGYFRSDTAAEATAEELRSARGGADARARQHHVRRACWSRWRRSARSACSCTTPPPG